MNLLIIVRMLIYSKVMLKSKLVAMPASIFMDFILVLLHLFHSLFHKHGCASSWCFFLHLGKIVIDTVLKVIDIIGMSLLESDDCRANYLKKWLEDDSVDNFGAHKWTKRQLEPDQEEKLHRVIEWNDVENPADVHICHSETPIAHPVGEPGWVILRICVGL